MFTKGKWYLEEETGQILCIPDRAGSHVIVADVWGGSVSSKPLAELLANAHLVAAAPDLYEALKESTNVLLVALELMLKPEAKAAMQSMIDQNQQALAKVDSNV